MATWAAAIVLTLALPVALDQGYFRYNPYILPILGLIAVLLYLGLAVTSGTCKKIIKYLYLKSPRFSLIGFIVIGVTIVGLLGICEWFALRKSIDHVNELHAEDKARNNHDKVNSLSKPLEQQKHPSAEEKMPQPTKPLRSTNKTKEEVKGKNNVDKTERPDLRKLFDEDFSTHLRTGINRKLGIKSGTTEKFIIISEKEYLDFAGKSKFLGYYIPSSTDTYQIIEYLSDFYKTTLDEFDKKTETQAGHVAESHMTSSRDLVFSGRIYIYHVTFLSLQERAALERLYESKGLSVIFRGNEYLLFIWESKH